MSTWSGIRNKLESDYLCPALRGHIQYFATSYSKSADHEGRAAIRMGAKKRRCMSMSKKRLFSIVVSAVILLSFACTAMAAEKSERYVGDSTVNGSIYQTYYQVDAQTRTGVKKISVSGVLYEKGTIGTWQKVSSCSNSSTTSTCMVSSSFNTKPGKSYRLEYSATFSYSDGRSETITGSTSR